MPIIEVTEPRRYHKPIVLPERLDLLTGPTTGVVVLPRHLKWSGNPRYDLESPGRIIDLYHRCSTKRWTLRTCTPTSTPPC